MNGLERTSTGFIATIAWVLASACGGNGHSAADDTGTGSATTAMTSQADTVGGPGDSVGATSMTAGTNGGTDDTTADSAQDTAVDDTSGEPPELVVVQSGDGLVSALVTDAESVYFTLTVSSTGAVKRVDKETEEMTDLFVWPEGCDGLVLGGEYLYATCGDPDDAGMTAIVQAPLSGGEPVILHSKPFGLWNLAADPSRVYFMESPAWNAIDAAGGPPTTLAMRSVAASASGAVLDAESYYLNDEGTLLAMPLLGGEIAELADHQATGISRLEHNDTTLFFLAEESRILTVPKAGGAPVDISRGQPAGANSPFAVDDTLAYFFNGSRLYSIPVAGGEGTVVAVWGEAGGGPIDIIVEPDAIWVLWQRVTDYRLARALP